MPEPRNHPETERAYVFGHQRRHSPPGGSNEPLNSFSGSSTHLKIVVVALVAGIAVAAFGISARTNTDYSQTAHVVKAGKPVVVTSSDLSKVQ